MKKEFTVEMTINKTQTVVVNAENEAESIEKAKNGLEDWQVDKVNDRMYIGQCEFSDKHIFEGDEYTTDLEADMYYLLSEVPKEAIED